MGEVIQLQGDQRKDVQEFLVAKDGLELDAKTIKVRRRNTSQPRHEHGTDKSPGPRFLDTSTSIPCYHARTWKTDRSCRLAIASPFSHDFFLPTTFMTITSDDSCMISTFRDEVLKAFYDTPLIDTAILIHGNLLSAGN